jgi:hypothetical protein
MRDKWSGGLIKWSHCMAWPAPSLSQTEMDKGDGQMTMHNAQDMVLIHFVEIGEFAKDLKRINLDR